MLRNEQQAPSFELTSSEGETVSLASQNGKPVVLVFFRGKFCPTSKRFLTAYQDFYPRIKDMGMELLAISFDTPVNHASLKDQLSLKFPLLSDPSLATLKEYGLYIDKNLERQEYGEPAIVIVDKDGMVVYSAISSGAKGLPDPGSIAPTLIYMAFHGGKY